MHVNLNVFKSAARQAGETVLTPASAHLVSLVLFCCVCTQHVPAGTQQSSFFDDFPAERRFPSSPLSGLGFDEASVAAVPAIGDSAVAAVLRTSGDRSGGNSTVVRAVDPEFQLSAPASDGAAASGARLSTDNMPAHQQSHSLDGNEGVALIEELWRVPIAGRYCGPNGRTAAWGAVVRAGYFHDQRYEFTGTESTFGAESQLYGELCEPCSLLNLELTGELYLTEPFHRNFLVDYPERESFRHNFDVEPVEISQLNVGWSHGDWAFVCGRFVTPFGRYYLPLFSNNRSDAPFIRSESILFRETGLMLTWEPRDWSLALAMTNGCDGRDTNSSKGVVSRVGIDREHFVGGISVKWQDGQGSEGQKQFNNHAGMDWLFRTGRWAWAGEFIYDQYGIRRPGLDLDSITWGRSLYNRQLNVGLNQPIEGLGYYSSVIYLENCRTWTLTYGQFFPNQIGDPIHDTTTHRLMGQVQWWWSDHASSYVSTFWENEVPNAQAGRTRYGFYLLTGLQYAF